ncbi:MAG: class I SAM-dependent methyltransferase [Pseudomonadota bacterium]
MTINSQAVSEVIAEHQADNFELSSYDDWAWLYDQTVGRDYADPLWHWILRELLPQLKAEDKVLDLCCGTGQVMRPLIDYGFNVTGLDASEQMLKYAKNNVPEATFIQADAREYVSSATYSAVVCTSASLNHIENLEDLSRVFQSVCQSLQPGGYFLFDINHIEQMKRWWRGLPLEGYISKDFAWMITPYFDIETNTGNFCVTFYRPYKLSTSIWQKIKNRLYELLDKPRFIGLRLKLISHFSLLQPDWSKQENSYPVVGHSLDSVESLLLDAGFSSVKIMNINSDPLVDENHSAHFVCQKAAA